MSSLQDALDRVASVLHFTNPRDYVVLLVWAGQSHIISLLDEVFYLGVTGPTGSGKGTTVKAGIHLCANGVVLSSGSPAYLKHTLDGGTTVGIQELDSVLKESESLLSMLRNGYQRDGAIVGMMVPEGKRGHKKADVNVFGPKILDFHAGLDTHLRGRTHVIEMERDNSAKRVFNARKKKRVLAPVKDWLGAQAAKILANWPTTRVDAYLDTPAFQDRVEKLGGTLARDHEIGMVMLLVCDLFEWASEDAVREIVRARKTLDEYGVQAEVLDQILSRIGADPGEEVATNDLLRWINDERKAANLRPLSGRAQGGALKDLGFTKPQTWRKATVGPNRNKWVIFPNMLRENLEQMAQVERPRRETAPDAPLAPRITGEKDQWVLNAIKSNKTLAATGPKGAPYDAVIAQVAAHGVTKDDAEAIITRLEDAGVIEEPVLGFLLLKDESADHPAPGPGVL